NCSYIAVLIEADGGLPGKDLDARVAYSILALLILNEEKQQYDTMIIKGRNDDTRLYPYSGYWLFMSDNGTLAAISA
ncbi:MAG TPA: hypothetical protein PLY78_05515, partial [Methanospirillum sp.]|nr:hypothetical protein [Methanospirillum sp.]